MRATVNPERPAHVLQGHFRSVGRLMQNVSGVEIRFIAGFGPIVRDASSRKLYVDDLGISFDPEAGGCGVRAEAI